MIGFLIRTSIKLLLLSALLYVTFFVQVGERTVYDHARRIARTREAAELFSGIDDAASKAKEKFAKLELKKVLGKVAN
jgi:hypothetical protein